MNLDDTLQSAAVAVLEAHRPPQLPAEVTIRQERDTTPKDRPLLYFLTENPKRPHRRMHQVGLVLVAEARRTAEGEGAEDANTAGAWHDATARAFYRLVPFFADQLRPSGYKLHRIKEEAPTSEPDGESGWKFTARWVVWVIEE